MRLTLLQWNIDYREPIAAIVQQITSWQPDIICLQELTNNYQKTHPDTGRHLAQALGFEHHLAYGPMTLPDGSPVQMGMGIFSRFPMSRRHTITLQKGEITDGRITRDARHYIDCSLDVRGEEFAVSTTHLPFHPRFRTTTAKQIMATAILERRKHLPANHIFAGDLNATPGTKTALRLRQDMRNGGPAWHTKTWTTKPFTIGPWSYRERQWRLDYILYRGALRRHTAKVAETILSDHLPLLTTFVLPNSKL